MTAVLVTAFTLFVGAAACASAGWRRADPVDRGAMGRAIAVVCAGYGLGAWALAPELAAQWQAPRVLWPSLVLVVGAAAFAPAYVAWLARAASASVGASGALARALDWLLFNLGVAAAVIELCLRLYAPFSENPLLLPESAASREIVNDVRQRLERRKGTTMYGVPFNSLGFRDDEPQRPKPPDVFRIVALADSFGVVANVPPEHFHMNQLEDRLQGLAGDRRVEIANLGISATGPHHYLSVLEEIGAWLEPDLVALYLFVGNDFAGQHVMEQNFRSRWDVFFVHRVAARMVRFLRTDRTHIDSGGPSQRQRPSGATPDFVLDWRLEEPGMPRDDFLAIEVARARVLDARTDEGLFEVTLGYLEEIRELAFRLTRRPLVVVIVPDEMQVNDALRAEVEALVGYELDILRPQRIVSQRTDSQDVLLVDLLPALQDAEKALGRVYHLQNTHWNANGNGAVAKEIARQLARRPELFE